MNRFSVCLSDRNGSCRDEVLEVKVEDSLSPVIDAIHELGPKVCGLILGYYPLVFLPP